MSIFKADMKVIHKETKQIGTIERVYNDLEVAIVNFENGIEKVTFDRLGIWVDVNATKDESVPGKKIITKDDFVKAVDFVCQPENMLDGRAGKKIDDEEKLSRLGFQCLLFGFIMVGEIYGESEEIEVTREELEHLIIENCSPAKLGELTNNQGENNGQLFMTSIAQMIVLKEIVPYFFGRIEK